MSDTQQFSARKANKNAILLMLRSAIGIVIGLYTSRIIYNSLGIDDYGLNAVIGGMLPLLTFISSTLSAATSRFLTFEIGKGDIHRIRETFTAAFYTHVALAILVALICELVGIYLLYHQLNIPAGREIAGIIVLQCSVVGIIFNVTQVPYSAVLIANERFNIYAYISLSSSILGLIAAFLVKAIHTDKLILYVCLNLIINIITILTTRFYCLKHHQESHLLKRVNFSILRPILSYSSWELFSYFCSNIYDQSRNYLVNIFFGVRYNTTISVANTVYGATNSLTHPLLAAFAPQFTKQYAQGNFSELSRAIITSYKLFFLAIGLLFIPCFFNAESLFLCWLGSVPPFAPYVLQCILIHGLFYSLTAPFVTVIQATGHLKNYSIAYGVTSLLLFILVYVVYRLTQNFQYGYIVFVFGQTLYSTILLLSVRQYAPQLNIIKLVMSNIPVLIAIFLTSCVTFLLCNYLEDGISQIIISSIASSIVFLSISFIIVLKQQEKDIILDFTRKKTKSIIDSFKRN